MATVILIIHLFLALAIIGLVLLQRSEGGGLGMGGGGGGGGLGGLTTARGAASMITRATAICAAAFFITSLVLGVLAGGGGKAKSVLDTLSDAKPALTQPAKPTPPSVPVE